MCRGEESFVKRTFDKEINEKSSPNEVISLKSYPPSGHSIGTNPCFSSIVLPIKTTVSFSDSLSTTACHHSCGKVLDDHHLPG